MRLAQVDFTCDTKITIRSL